VTASTAAETTWAPLRSGVFRALWLAVLVSNIGAWMQTVGAQWLLVSVPHASILVALVQTADYLPDMMFGLVGGVLADSFDRRRLLIAVEAALLAVGVALTVLTIAGQMPPALLLTFTFLLGTGSVLTLPAYQSLVPDLVPRQQVRSASVLSSLSINLARAAGPAIAGLVIARVGVGAVFGLNALTYLVFLLVLLAWRPPAGAPPRAPERFISALLAGGRYVRYSPVMLRLLLHVALFLVPATSLWALLPLIGSQRLRLGASGYGLLLAALGVGAIVAALTLGRVRARIGVDILLPAAGLVFAAALALLVLVSNPILIVLGLLPAGIAWIAVLSTMNAELQLFLPAWVRARGLSVYQMIVFGSQALAAILWGFVGELAGLEAAFLIAAGMMAIAAVLLRVLPLLDTSDMDRSTVSYWPEPRLAMELDPASGPVLVTTAYTIAPERERAFLEAMDGVRLLRLRTGGTRWGLFRDGETPHRFIELFAVPSWDEHLRQHGERLTGADRQLQQRASDMSDPPPETSHLIAVEVPS
jgi:MFS family permease